jgi:5-methylcytosine-specific restriction endonuclease McrBC regulatory subunit McrC
MSYTPDYKLQNLQKIVRQNLKPITHPYFTEYRPLQKLCLKILRQDKISFGSEKDKIHGLLFDGAWLWEEYIATLFKEKSPEIEHLTRPDKLFEKDSDDIKKGQGIIPDFIIRIPKTKHASFIGDTKYKHFAEKTGAYAREDYFQVIAYMYRYLCHTGYIFFPHMDGGRLYNKRTIDNGTEEESCIREFGLYIPQEAFNFKDFCGKMENSENEFIEALYQNKNIKYGIKLPKRGL